jgi:hypothetical protein
MSYDVADCGAETVSFEVAGLLVVTGVQAFMGFGLEGVEMAGLRGCMQQPLEACMCVVMCVGVVWLHG